MNKYRIGTDVPFQLSVDDGVEYLDLSNCTILNVAMYCDAQEAFAGSCTWQLNADDHTRLDCVYPGDRQVYTGIMRAVVVMVGADGGKKAYDLADIFEIVATTEEANATEDTVTSAVLSAWQLPMSTLSTIVEAAINATEAASGSTIAEISYTASTEDDGVNVLHIEQADGTAHNFNIKNGSKGSQGIQGPRGEQGPQGEQGNTGSSVDYPFELVNNVTTDDATKALTAAMGVQLEGEISQLQQDVNEKLDGVEVTNPMWLWVITDKDGRVLGGVKVDGSIEWAIGIPKPIKDELDSLTLTVAGKEDKVDGKSLIDSAVAEANSSFDNPDYLYLMTDENGKIVIGIKNDGKLYADLAGIPADVQEEVDDLQGQINDITSGAEGEEKYFQLSEQSNNIIDVIGFSSFKEKTMTIISPDKYSCWPRMGKVGNKLICAYVKGLQHEDPHNGTGAIWVSTSANGVVWTPKRLIIDTENIRDGVTGGGNDANGDFLLINRVGYPGNANTYHDIYKTTNGIDFVKISTIPASTPLGHIGDIINVPTRGLMAFFGEYGSAAAPWGYILSSDNGETWTKNVVETVVREERPMEMSAAYLGNGKIIVAGRYEGNGSAYMWQMQSEDYGETWTRQVTNISGNSNTPSLIFDQDTNKISLYIYNRSTGKLEYRQVDVEDVWNNPTGWPTATIISTGATGQDAGNVSAVAFKGSQFAAFYSGNSTNTGIYSTIN